MCEGFARLYVTGKREQDWPIGALHFAIRDHHVEDRLGLGIDHAPCTDGLKQPAYARRNRRSTRINRMPTEGRIKDADAE